jgi:hypothetical protein
MGSDGQDRIIGGKGADILCGGNDLDSYSVIDDEDQGYDDDQRLIGQGNDKEDRRMEKELYEQLEDEFDEFEKLADEFAKKLDKYDS